MRTMDGLSLNPYLPDAWQGYTFQFDYRSRLIRVEVTRGSAKVKLLRGQPIDFTLCSQGYTLTDEINRSIS